MKLLIDGNEMPSFKKMAIESEDAISSNRGQSGMLNVDRSFSKDIYTFEYDFFDVEFYTIIKTLYERQFSEGKYFVVQLIDHAFPINTPVFIPPQNIVPRFGGSTLEGYSLTLQQR